jgi:hypothetical protein
MCVCVSWCAYNFVSSLISNQNKHTDNNNNNNKTNFIMAVPSLLRPTVSFSPCALHSVNEWKSVHVCACCTCVHVCMCLCVCHVTCAQTAHTTGNTYEHSPQQADDNHNQIIMVTVYCMGIHKGVN